MFFGNLKKTWVRLTLWYSSILILSVLALFVVTYLLLSKSIRDKDRRVALTKITQYSDIMKQRGPDALITTLDREDAANQQAGFLVRLSDVDNHTLFLTLPVGWTKIDPRFLEQTRLRGVKKWVVLRQDEISGELELRSIYVTKDIYLQVGFGMEDWKRLMGHFRNIFALLILPVIALGALGGFFVARRALMPVKHLVGAIHGVETGSLDARVPIRRSGDELDELARLFNAMLDKIETLVNGMKESLANVAHDLRTPMTRLRVGVESALQTEGDVETLREALLDCAEESERIVTVLNTLMDLSEAETGAMSLHMADADLAALLAEAVELYQYVAEDKKLDIRTEMPSALPARIDPVRIRQVLANLLDNAIKYTPEGERIEIKALSKDDQAIIHIKDNGLGIPPEDLPRIFDRLFRGDKSRSHRGLGLGLSLVQAVVKAHHGRVEVESTPGQGSTFSLYLPLKPPGLGA